MPKVSIVTPCFNSAAFILDTYKSIAAQTFTDWEWIIVDDCSTDESIKKINSLVNKDKRISIFQNIKNSGASVSRNKGLEESSGEYIAFLDADDLWNEDKINHQYEFMRKNEIAFTYHNYCMMGEDGTFLKEMTSPNEVSKKTLEIYNPIFTSSVMIKKNVIGSTRFKEELRRRQDYIFWYEIIKKTKLAKNVGENLGQYRTGNKTSLSGNKFRNIPIQWNIYRKEFGLNLFSSSRSLAGYAVHGITKYFL